MNDLPRPFTPPPWRVHGKQLSGAYQITGQSPGSLRICTITNAATEAEEAGNAALIEAAPNWCGSKGSTTSRPS